MSDNQPTSLDSILRELHYSEKLTFNKDGTTTSEFNWAKFEAALNRLLIQERISGATELANLLKQYDWQLEDSINANDVVNNQIDACIAELSSLTVGKE